MRSRSNGEKDEMTEEDWEMEITIKMFGEGMDVLLFSNMCVFV